MNKKGFTLIELLAVIGILAVILVIAVPQVNDYILKRKKDLFLTNARNIARQLEYDNIEFKSFNKITLNELNLVGISIENIDLNNSIAYMYEGDIYVDLVGINQYKKLYACGVGVSNKNVSVTQKRCNMIISDIIYIDFDVNLDGGTTSQKFNEKYSSGNYLTLEIPKKTNYSFSHWELVSGDSVITGNRIKFGSASTTIKAVWVTNQSLTIDLDGGTINQKFEKEYPAGTNIPLSNPIKNGFVFIRWNIEEGNSIISGNTLTMGNTATKIKAVWEVAPNGAALKIQNLLANESKLKNGLIVDTTVDKNIRYAGSNPNNKVYFNCKDVDSNSISYGQPNYNYAGSCEVWRIIGIFKVDNGRGKIEKRVKIVRDAFVDNNGNQINMSFDSSANNGVTNNNSGFGINQWGESTYEDGTIYEGSDLMQMLNGYYIGKEDTCTYCNGDRQETCKNDCASSITPLSNTSLSMVESAVWNTGAVAWIDPMPITTMYNGERGTQTGKICTSGSNCNDKVTRTTEWIGLVGLIYPSDYGYASSDEVCASDIVEQNSTCENNNYLHPTNKWYFTISSLTSSTEAIRLWAVLSDRSIANPHASLEAAVRPSLYLSSNVEIIGGDGGSIPFKLSI